MELVMYVGIVRYLKSKHFHPIWMLSSAFKYCWILNFVVIRYLSNKNYSQINIQIEIN
jgi:hypothetical protein